MCNPAPVAQKAWTDTLATWPGVTFLGIIGDQAHATRRSSHNCAPMQESGAYDPNHAHALDIGHGGDRQLAALIRMAFLTDSRTRYVIDNGVGYKPDGSTFSSTGHTTHVHVSFLPGTTFDTRPFFDNAPTGDIDIMDDNTRAYLDAKFIALLAAVKEVGDELKAQAKRHNEAERKRDAEHAAG